MVALLLFTFLQADDKKLDIENTKLLVYDATKGYTLRIQDDGRVELSVKEEDKETGKKAARSYTAASAEEFRRKHPELVRKHELDRHLGRSGGVLTQDEFDEWWGRFKRQVPGLRPLPRGGNPFDEDFQKFFENQRELMEQLRKQFALPPGADPAPPLPPARPLPPPPPPGREFGVKVDTVGETLRDQLSLKEGEGVLVSELKPGSVAEKAGLKTHDLLLKVDGKPIGDRWQFRADVLAAMDKPSFEIELIRAGKRETVKVTTR